MQLGREMLYAYAHTPEWEHESLNSPVATLAFTNTALIQHQPSLFQIIACEEQVYIPS